MLFDPFVRWVLNMYLVIKETTACSALSSVCSRKKRKMNLVQNNLTISKGRIYLMQNIIEKFQKLPESKKNTRNTKQHIITSNTYTIRTLKRNSSNKRSFSVCCIFIVESMQKLQGSIRHALCEVGPTT